MITLRITQMGTLFLAEHFDLSQQLKTQIDNAPRKADIWQLGSDKDEWLSLRDAINKRVELLGKNSAFALLLEEMDEALGIQTSI